MSKETVCAWLNKQELQAINISSALLDKWSAEISIRHSEEWRQYHTLRHLADMMRYFQEMKNNITDHISVVLAILFHDGVNQGCYLAPMLFKIISMLLQHTFGDFAEEMSQEISYLPSVIVYNPESSTNEYDSVAVFKDFAKDIQLNDQIQEKVVKLITATIQHLPDDASPQDSDLAFFLDFDMAILGQSEQAYDMYAANIQKEYSHMSPEDFSKGRIKVLQSFLSRPRIYITQNLHKSIEDQARQNMLREIMMLQKPNNV